MHSNAPPFRPHKHRFHCHQLPSLLDMDAGRWASDRGLVLDKRFRPTECPWSHVPFNQASAGQGWAAWSRLYGLYSQLFNESCAWLGRRHAVEL